MNKTIKTIAVLLAGLTLTAGTAVAAPHHGRPCRPAPIHHRCPPPPRHHVVHHVEHHHAGGVGLVAGLVGGLIGGLIGAAAN